MKNYEDIVITDSYKAAIKVDRQIKVVDDTLLLYENDGWRANKHYLSPTEIGKESHSTLFVYAKKEEERDFHMKLSRVSRDSMISKGVEVEPAFSFSGKKSVCVRRDGDRVFSNTVVGLSNFHLTFVTIANSKAKKLNNIKGAIHYNEFFNNMKIVKKLGNHFYFTQKMSTIKSNTGTSRQIEEELLQNFFPYLKLVNTELFDELKDLTAELLEAYGDCNITSSKANSEFEKEMIQLAREKGVLRGNEIDKLITEIKSYRSTFIDIDSQPIQSVANIIHFARKGNNKISKKYYLKYSRSQLVGMFTSDKTEDKLLLEYITQYGNHTLENVLPSKENKRKILTF